MTTEERDRLTIEAIKKVTAQACKSPESALAFLKSAGIIQDEEELEEFVTENNSEEALTECYVPCDEYTGLKICHWDEQKCWLPIANIKRIKLPSPAVGGMRELRQWVIEQRNMAHINCLEAKKNALNSVINHIDGLLKDSSKCADESILHDLECWKKRAEHFEKEFDAANKEVIYLQSKIKSSGLEESASPAVKDYTQTWEEAMADDFQVPNSVKLKDDWKERLPKAKIYNKQLSDFLLPDQIEFLNNWIEKNILCK